MRERTLLKASAVLGAMALMPLTAGAEDIPYDLKEGQQYAGTKFNIPSVVTPQFDGLMLRDDEFAELTGIEAEWTL